MCVCGGGSLYICMKGFVCVVVGGLGSLFGAFVASLLIGWLQTFAASYNVGAADILIAFGYEFPKDVYYHPWRFMDFNPSSNWTNFALYPINTCISV